MDVRRRRQKKMNCHTPATPVATPLPRRRRGPATIPATDEWSAPTPLPRRRRGPATIPATDAWNTATTVAAPVPHPCHASRTCAPRPRRLSTTDEVRLLAVICIAALICAAMLALLEGALG